MKKLLLLWLFFIFSPTKLEGAIDPVSYFVSVYSADQEVDPKLIMAMIRAESGGNQKATSKKGAIGIMQLMPTTAKMLGVNPHILKENIRGGVTYISQQLREFKNVRLALAAYNAGPGNIYKYGRNVPPFKETIRYISTICSDYACG